jgi:hypothetical protein
MQQESGGKAGVQAYAKAGDGSYARGLMQCIKSVTDDYNKTHQTHYDHKSVMGGTSQAAARIQIRVGIWLLRRKQGQVEKWLTKRVQGTPAHRDVVMIGDTAYAMGWGATRKKLQKLEAEGLPLTFDSLAEHFPMWGYSQKREKWINRPLKHARGTWKRYQAAEGSHPYGATGEGEGADIEPVEPPGDIPEDTDEPLPSDEQKKNEPPPEWLFWLGLAALVGSAALIVWRFR